MYKIYEELKWNEVIADNKLHTQWPYYGSEYNDRIHWWLCWQLTSITVSLTEMSMPLNKSSGYIIYWAHYVKTKTSLSKLELHNIIQHLVEEEQPQ